MSGVNVRIAMPNVERLFLGYLRHFVCEPEFRLLD